MQKNKLNTFMKTFMKTILYIIFLCIIASCNKKEIEVKITDKNIKTIKRDDEIVSLYMIYTDKGVFKNEDNFWFFKFNSSDLYGKIEIGKCYILTTRFWRNNFLSWYPNIMKVENIQCKTINN